MFSISILALAATIHAAPAPAPDTTLISRSVEADGAIAECRRVPDAPAGWLAVTCSTRLFQEQAVFEPVKTHVDKEAIFHGLIQNSRPWVPFNVRH